MEFLPPSTLYGPMSPSQHFFDNIPYFSSFEAIFMKMGCSLQKKEHEKKMENEKLNQLLNVNKQLLIFMFNKKIYH